MAHSVTKPSPDVIHYQTVQSGRLAIDLVRRIRAGIPHLSPSERQFLKDFARGRFNFEPTLRLLRIAARCKDDVAALSPIEIGEAVIMAEREQPDLPIDEAIRAEDAGEFTANVAVREYTLHPDPLRARIAMEQGYTHELRLRRLRHGLARVAGRLA